MVMFTKKCTEVTAFNKRYKEVNIKQVVQRCSNGPLQRSAKRWMCSTRGATRRRPCVHQGEGGGERDCEGWSDISSPWSLQCWTLLCLWLCWQRHIFPLDSRTWFWTWTWDRGIVEGLARIYFYWTCKSVNTLKFWLWLYLNLWNLKLNWPITWTTGGWCGL